MPEKIGRLGYVIVDCLDNEKVATFWGQVLGLEITDRSDPYSWHVMADPEGNEFCIVLS